MKIIHTADIHLDSPLIRVKDAATRRYELLRALSNMSEYANNNGAAAIIVAGDLFDNKYATEQTIRGAATVINDSKANWYVLQGNHGDGAPYQKLKGLAPKLNLFGEDWTCYDLGDVVICGRELGRDDAAQYQKLQLDQSKYNVVVLHGDVDSDAYGLIDGKTLSQSGAQYIALGHRHAFSPFKFGKVKACYCGTLETRGFDETNETGFVVLDTDKDTVKFVPQAIRRVENVEVDVTGISNDLSLRAKILSATASADCRNYLNVKFTGELNEQAHLNVVARDALADRFFALRTEDATVTSFNLAELGGEVSLRGEFVKLAQSIEDDDMRQSVIKFGLKALGGEVLE